MDKAFKAIPLVLISIFGLYFSFKNINFNDFVYKIINIDILYLFFSIVLLFISVLLRSVRLRCFITPIDSGITLNHSFSSTMIGYFGNGILFFRLGEVLKAYSISKNNKIKVSESFGVIMLERIIDAGSLLFLIILVLPWMSLGNSSIRYWVISFSIITILLMIFILLIKKINWMDIISLIPVINDYKKKKLVKLVNNIFYGIDSLKNNQYLFRIVLSTFGMWVCYFIMTVFIIYACNITITLFEIYMTLVIGAIIVSVPALPGGLGTYEAGITYAMMILFSLSKDEALTYALISHAANYFPFLAVGAIYFIFSGLSIKDVNKGIL